MKWLLERVLILALLVIAAVAIIVFSPLYLAFAAIVKMGDYLGWRFAVNESEVYEALSCTEWKTAQEIADEVYQRRTARYGQMTAMSEARTGPLLRALCASGLAEYQVNEVAKEMNGTQPALLIYRYKKKQGVKVRGHLRLLPTRRSNQS